MILLLDTHVLLWWLADDPALTNAARQAIADPANDVLVSAATVWEIGIKRELGKLEAPATLLDAIDDSGFGALPITAVDADVAARLPTHHRDPFDRMVIAQAERIGATIVSRDAAFALYEVSLLQP